MAQGRVLPDGRAPAVAPNGPSNGSVKRSADLVQSDGAGRHEHFTLTDTGAKRLVGASAAVAAVQKRMLATFDPEQRRRLYADLAACADALS